MHTIEREPRELTPEMEGLLASLAVKKALLGFFGHVIAVAEDAQGRVAPTGLGPSRR